METAGGMKTVDVSVIIPVYNGERYLAEAIGSVLTQTIQPREIIVVDDGSTDGSTAVAERFSGQVQLYRQKNRGASSARNRGIEVSEGSFLAFLDADDLWLPDKLECQWREIHALSGVDMVLGTVVQFISPDVAFEKGPQLRKDREAGPAYLMGAMLVRRDSFFRVGLLNETLQLGEFIDWFQRARDMGLRWKVMDSVVLKRRIHLTNQGITKRANRKDYVSVLKMALDRKRQASSKKADV